MIVARDLFLFVYVALLVVENEPVQNHMSKPVNNLNFRHMPTTTINSRNRHFHCKQALPQRHPPTLACTQSCTNNISTIHCTAAKLRARKNCKHKSKRTHLSHRAPITTRVHGTNPLGGVVGSLVALRTLFSMSSLFFELFRTPRPLRRTHCLRVTLVSLPVGET